MAYVNKGIDRSAPMNRTGAFPLDEKSYFESYAAALSSAQTAEAAGSSATSYYFGQLMTVFEDNAVKTYKIVPTEVTSEVEGENGEKQTVTTTIGDLEQIDAEGITYDFAEGLSADANNKVGVKCGEGLSVDTDNKLILDFDIDCGGAQQ
jgi:hypothetical protein